MACVTVYEPNSIVLEESSRHRRQLRTTVTDVDAGRPLSAEELSDYDDRTLIYDVALTSDNRRLVSVLPPPVNLERELFPLSVEVVNGGHIELTTPRRRTGRLSDVMWLSRRLRRPVEKSLVVKVELADGASQTFEVHPHDQTPVDVAIATLQKDNRTEWVTAWVRHYARLGVRRILLYDNGSGNADELLAALRALPLDVAIVLVRWAFPYGPGRSFENNFAQSGALNHARHVLAGSAWLANFDVDEYLVSKDWDAKALLARAKPWHGALVFDSYFMPHQALSADGPPTIENQLLREQAPRRWAGRKYIVRTARARELGPHSADTTPFRSHRLPIEDASFFHYVGISTNWKADHWDRTRTVDPTDNRYVRDTRVRDFHEGA